MATEGAREWRVQKENPYNKLLPYAHLLDEEALRTYRVIKKNLLLAVWAKEMRPGCMQWTRRFLQYIRLYGLKFSKEDHIAYIHLYYELVTVSNLAPARINNLISVLHVLLKKYYLLSPNDLQLDWRALYDLSVRIFEKGKLKIGMLNKFPIGMDASIKSLIFACKAYFPAEATQEILDEFRPHLCPFNLNNVRAISYLCTFLPVDIAPGKEDIGYNLWFTEFMHYWEVCHNAAEFEFDKMQLMAKLAERNCARIDWEPYLPIMYVRFLRCLQLPIGYRQKQSSRKYKMDISDIACWIVYTLESKSGLAHLETFMQRLESYYHSANMGKWKPKLFRLLNRLAFHFVERLHNERFRMPNWRPQTPAHLRITDAQVERFVAILKPCLEHGMFSTMGNRDAAEAFKSLASLRADLIVPLVLDKVYTSMNTLTEPHKLTASMSCLIAIARFMVGGARSHYPEGPTHVIPLLHTLLPGIDPNDFRKCCTTFNAIGVLTTLAPIVDSSRASTHYQLTEEEHTICEASATYEDFVLQFFERIFAWVEAQSLEFTRFEQIDHHLPTRMEMVSERALFTAITVILFQCSPEIFTSALKKLQNFALNRILESRVSGKMVAILCSAFAKVNPTETLRMLLPQLCETIETLLGSGDDVVKEDRLSDDLLYNLLLLSELVDARDAILPYVDRITRILDRTIHMSSDSGSQMAAVTLDAMMATLTIIEPIENGSMNTPLSTPLPDYFSVRDWARDTNVKDVKIEWYVPGEAAIDCVQSLIAKYLVPELELLRKYASGEQRLEKKPLRETLRIILAMLSCKSVLPLFEEEPLQILESLTESPKFDLIIGPQYKVYMPDGSNVLKVIVDTIHSVQERLLAIDEGDINSLNLIIMIYESVLFNKLRGQDYERQYLQFVVNKRSMEDRLHDRHHQLRQIHLERMTLLQVYRSQHRVCHFTATHKQIVLDLFELSVSHYSEVRITAQVRLYQALSFFMHIQPILLPPIKAILAMDTQLNHEKFKGCLHVLVGPKHPPLIAITDRYMLREVWPQLVNARPSEKLSIVNLMDILQEEVGHSFATPLIKFAMPAKCGAIVRTLADQYPTVDLSAHESEAEKGAVRERELDESRARDQQETIARLLHACNEGNLHWRHQSMALHFIREMANRETKYEAPVVNYFFRALLHESLAVRKLALRVCLCIMVQNKPTFAKVVYREGGDQQTVAGPRADNEWLMYDGGRRAQNDADWERMRFIDKEWIGYYGWPKKVEGYAPRAAQQTFAQRASTMCAEEREMFDFLSVEDNVKRMIEYFAMEEKKGKDRFNFLRFLFFKYIFKTFEDHFLPPFTVHLNTLINDTQEQSQRCAMEILAGVISGAKHWSYAQTQRLRAALLPILTTGLAHISVETVSDWCTCMLRALHNRDPNRYAWLLEFLLHEPLTHTSSFIDCGRLQVMQVALRHQSWRNRELWSRLLHYLSTNLASSFQNVRDVISCSLALALSHDLTFGAQNSGGGAWPEVTRFVEMVMPRLNGLYEETLREPEKTRHATVEAGADEKTESVRLFKTVAQYVTYSLRSANYAAVPAHFALFPLVCVLQNNDTDEEYAKICTQLLAMFAYTPLLKDNVPAALEAIARVSTCAFWSARAVLAEFIPAFVFHNYSTLAAEVDWVEEMQRIVLMLLEDEQPEVRIKAGEIISGFLHCRFVIDQQSLLNSFKEKSRTKLKSKTAGPNPGASGRVTSNGNKAVIVRHAGVLGLCAFVSSHPYDVPDFLPEIFLELGKHLNDPQPIPTTIRQTFGNFKRTHHSNWECDKLNFTEDQLSLLNDLTVPPSYYA